MSHAAAAGAHQLHVPDRLVSGLQLPGGLLAGCLEGARLHDGRRQV